MEFGELDRGRPGDVRAFIHRRVLGFVGGLGIPGISTAANIVKGVVGGGGGSQVVPQTFPQTLPFSSVIPGRSVQAGANGRACPRGTVWDRPTGACVSPRSPFGREQREGTAVMGRYGAAEVPFDETRLVMVCPTGTALGKDDLCYAHLPNRDRKYPRGRRPLLTGGDMRSISRARRAGNRLANAKSDLIAIGMLKAPSRRKRRKKPSVPCA